MKNLKTLLIIILLNISLSTVALPPDMQADRYLLQVEKVLKGKNKDYHKAAEYMDKIMALKDQHNLELPIEFYFKYANILLESIFGGSRTKADVAFAAINHYLTATGKSGANYAEALDLYDKAIFWKLVQAKNKNKVEQLIKLGANIHAKDKHEISLFHRAASDNENPEVIKVLIQAGADVDAKDFNKRTPLHWAASLNKNPEVIKVLIQAGADVDAKDSDKRTPLYNAALDNENPEVIKVLIQAGADVNAKDSDKTPLHDAAIGNENPEVIKVLIQAGADVNAEGRYGTPLHNAALGNENPEVIKVLIQAGANVNEETRRLLKKNHPSLFR